MSLLDTGVASEGDADLIRRLKERRDGAADSRRDRHARRNLHLQLELLTGAKDDRHREIVHQRWRDGRRDEAEWCARTPPPLVRAAVQALGSSADTCRERSNRITGERSACGLNRLIVGDLLDQHVESACRVLLLPAGRLLPVVVPWWERVSGPRDDGVARLRRRGTERVSERQPGRRQLRRIDRE